MRFGKEFVSKMIPEWQEAYIDYAYLKTILQDIQASRKLSESSSQNNKPSFARNLTRRYNRDALVSEDHDIVVNTVTREIDTTYETVFLKAGEAGGDSEVAFFGTLDREFNKVNSFYRSKVEKARSEAVSLSKQMDALIAFRLRVMEKKPSHSASVSVDIDSLASEIGSSSKSGEHRVALGELMRNEETANESILERIRMNKTRESPLSAIKAIVKVHKQDELKFTRDNLKKAEELLQIAFIEFYQKLRYLKNYAFLNTLAISKIMKKYDKIAARNASKLYMEMVDGSYLTSSDEVHKLMLSVESTLTEHFCNSNRSQGMNLLRPKVNKETHRITFSTGFFFGCAISLIIALALIIHARNILGTPGQRTYMETMFPLYRFFGFVVLHMIMYAANIYFWKRFRVNYSFIFGFKQGTELGYRHVLLLSFGLGTLSLCAVLLNLDMEMDSQTKDYKTVTELIPLFLLSLVIAITLCPFNILYRSSRFFFLAVLFRCIAAPFYTVNLPDFFLADQLTSQVQAFRSLEFYICYYGFGDFRQRQRNTCRSNDVFTTFYFIVAVIPYWLRFIQCIRRIFEDKDLGHGYNAIKYLLTIIAACLRTAFTLNRGTTWNITAWVLSGVATLYATYWDIVVDWGLFQRGCKNSFLRDKLLVPHKTVYYAAMVLNVLLRLVWLQTVLDLKFSFLHRETLVALLACLEIIRRGIWNFFRLENEHLNNVGKFRAFKSVPLPFNYQEDGDQHRLEVKPGKPQSCDLKNEEGKVHVTQATLGEGSGKEKSVIKCSVGDKTPIYLCSLLPNKTECCPLNLEFNDDDETVEFSVTGPRSIHLSGYLEEYDQEGDEQDEDDSDGIDIGESESEEASDSEYDSEEDQLDDLEDFLDTNLEMYRQASVPKSGVVIEEIEEDEEKPAKDNKAKRPKKKIQPTKDENANKQIIVKESAHVPVLESEDEDGFPIPKGKAPEPENKTGKKMDLDDDEQGSSKKRKAKASEQDGVQESANKSKKKKNQKEKKKGEADEQVQAGNVLKKQESSQNSPTPKAQKGTVNNAMSESSNTPVKSAEKKNKNKKKNNSSEEATVETKTNSSKAEKSKSGSIERNQEDSKASQERTYPNGLIVEELGMGKPNGKKAAPGKQVSVRYIGKLQKNGKIFDSNIGKKPFTFRLGVGQVIKGWDVGVNGMRVGDKRKLTIPPSMGYGAGGAGSQIPPNAWLTFDVELIDVR
ncbi:unnamed protein product [Thlaspi arvense]|uniref:peptidylprolyl isomerase n=1 Tax=Thlaspi arvense TaxID=13288 RepID=A0AAU9T444_THLAR|nr:unnamed protein product [Thlaspi arvense]